MKPVRQYLLFCKTSRGCGLVTLALALAWVAHGANPVLIGQWPGKPRGPAVDVAVSGNYAYVADMPVTWRWAGTTPTWRMGVRACR